ncbi:hypothetical protein [Pantoea phage LIMEzero]|uniref:Uncharacterized protein n=1 Tax=Pantoea phage LIMEzero TaxID=943335 RepID=F4N9T2_9CAUD|nr:hypothetical protein LIMEzero_ORF29 [Pantoea phage LIMEzero]CBY88560.1 hypothetical protein [Pantoea phage LIMEzero]
MSYTKLHDELVIGRDWQSRTTVEVDDTNGTVFVEQCDEDGDVTDAILIPPEYVPGIIRALEKAIEKE